MIGQVLGHYRIVDRLGAGGMGEVYRAEDTTLHREVALKVLPTELATSQDRLERFQREAHTLAALDHPNIVHIYSVESAALSEDQTVHFLTMQLVRGQPLAELISEDGLKLDHFFDLAIPLADALRAAHEKGIIHRDLKPENVMVDEEGRVKVLDFGLAKLRLPELAPGDSELPTQAMTQEGLVLGTVPYMSPEQVQGRPVDNRTDLFSFGILLYEMLCGRRPFAGENTASLVSSIMRDEPEPVADLKPGLPARLVEIVGRCLEKDRDSRAQTAQEIRDELQEVQREIVSGQAVLSQPIKTLKEPPSRFRKLGLLAPLVILTMIFGVFAWMNREPTTSESVGPQITSLAVLPLHNLSGDSEQDYFVDGMTEALITDLSKISALKVISRTSAMRYKGTDKSLADIAAELDVDAVIEGSVIREGDRVGITAQLIEVATDQSLWADRYERDLTSILKLQGEIAQAIAAEIQVTLTPQEQTLLTDTRQVDPEAYEAYLKGRFHWFEMTPQDLQTARMYFERALEKDPEYALAYIGLADAIATPAHIGLVSPTEVFPQAKEMILKALELDDTLAEAHDLLARFHFAWDWDWEAAEQEFQRSIQLNPNYPDVHAVYSQFLGIVGRWDRVLEEAQLALELDPQNVFYQTQVAGRLAWLGRYDEAITALQRLVEMEPTTPIGYVSLWDLYALKEMPEEALAAAKRYFELIGRSEVLDALDRGFAEAGYPGAMKLAAEILVESSASYGSPTQIAQLYAHAGLADLTLEWLERAVIDRDTHFVYTTVDPIYAYVWTDPRYQDLRRRINLPAIGNRPAAAVS